MAAYRSGEKLDDRSHGETQDYSHRSGVVHSEIVLPDNAPEWATDRAALWSEVENREKADNATLAREVQLSLPHEFTDAQRIELVQEFAQHVAAEYGLAVDMNIHTPSKEGDDRNHHAHLMITARAFDEDRADGWSKTKERRFNPKEMQQQGRENAVSEMREAWETMENRALERADIRDERGELVQVDRRSYEERGLEVEPTIKLGPAATEMQRRGEDSDRAQINDEIRKCNAARQTDREPTDRTQPNEDRAQIEREAAAVKLEMAELFETMASRPGIKMQFERRQRELEALHVEVKELLDEGRQRESDRMNEQLLGGPDDRSRESTALDLDREPQRRSRFYGLDELNRELAEPPEDRRKDRDGKGKEPQLLNTYPKQREPERPPPPPPEPERQGYGRSR